jgi:hypothetical protein
MHRKITPDTVLECRNSLSYLEKNVKFKGLASKLEAKPFYMF